MESPVKLLTEDFPDYIWVVLLDGIFDQRFVMWHQGIRAKIVH